MIDITMTAVLRPEVLEQTLTSFCKNIFTEKEKYRLIINIDQTGNTNTTPKQTLDVCKKFFKNIIYNVSNDPSFPKAVIWTWSKVENNYIFHLEDDWFINRPINIIDMIKILQNNKKLACLRLSKKNIPKSNNPIIFESRYKYIDGYFLAQNKKTQFGLNPVLIKKEFILNALPLLSPTLNPEKQFRPGNTKMMEMIDNWEFGIYAKPGDKHYVFDTGRKWRIGMRLKKPTAAFTKWEQIK